MNNAFDVVRQFEESLAEFAGSRYAVAVDSCSNAIFLSCLYMKIRNIPITIPKRTYPSVPAAILHAGGLLQFEDINWHGTYLLKPMPIVDGAKRFRRNMYTHGTLHCLSFHLKKHLPIGRGGAVLTNSKDAHDWLKLMSYDGREEKCPLSMQRDFTVAGWNFYMTPEQAARGLLYLQTHQAELENAPDQVEDPPYPDLSQMTAFRSQ